MADDTLAAVWAEIKANPGKSYVYVLSKPDGTAFYVGVGTGRRIRLHEPRAVAAAKPNAAQLIIRGIIDAGGGLKYRLVGWFEDWQAAAAEERRLIAEIGRADLGLGPLANRTNGGQGLGGSIYEMTAARREGSKRAGEKHRGRKLSPEHRAKIGAAHKGKAVSAETRSRMSKAQAGRKVAPEVLARMAPFRKRQRLPPEILEGGKIWRENNKELISASRKARWADEGYREKMSKALKGVKRSPEYAEQNRLRQIAKFKDPEFRERWNRARIEGIERRKRALQSS